MTSSLSLPPLGSWVEWTMKPQPPLLSDPDLIDDPSAVLWVPKTASTLTGPIPLGYIGRSPAEAFRSCLRSGCRLLPLTTRRRHGGGLPAVEQQRLASLASPHPGRCYAWSGNTMGAHRLMCEARAKSGAAAHSLVQALELRRPTATVVKLGAIGDPGVLAQRVVIEIDHQVRQAGLGMVAYAHNGHRTAGHLRGLVLTSVDDPEEADEAATLGWRVALVTAPATYTVSTTPAGRRILPCPALLPGSKATCNTCGRCDPARDADFIVGFPALRPVRAPKP